MKMLRCMMVLLCGLMLFSANANAAWWDRFKPKGQEPAKTETAAQKTVPAPAVKQNVPPQAAQPAAQAAATATQAGGAQTPALLDTAVDPAALSDEELLGQLTRMLEYQFRIQGAVPGVERVQDEKGVAYLYNGTDVKQMEKGALMGFYLDTKRQVSVLLQERFDRQQQQLKEIQKVQDLNRQTQELRNMNQLQRTQQQQRNLQQISRPGGYNPPKVYTPPKSYTPAKRY